VGVLVRKRRYAVLAAFAVVVAAASVPATAQASSTPTTYYVDNNNLSACSDTGPGTQAQPFCTVQTAATAAVVPGDTVVVVPGVYPEQVDITASGTASAPITFESGPATPGRAPQPEITSDGDDQHNGFVLTGASNIVIDDFAVIELPTAIVIDDSSAVTVNSVLASSSTMGHPSIQVSGSSSHITLSRDEADGGWHAPGIAIDAGGSGDVVTTNLVISETGAGGGISVQGSSGAVITSNTVIQQCGPGIYLGDDSNGIASGATIENNVVGPDTTGCASPGAGVELATAADTAGATLDYNDVYLGSGSGLDAYAWGGADYADAAALYAATGQAEADSNADPGDLGDGRITSPTSPLISSANSDAPGELPTDEAGVARTCDPFVTPTGVGHSACYDRGAFQYGETITFTGGGNPSNTVPVGAAFTVNVGTASSNWGKATFDYRFDFGDGTVVDGAQSSVTHTYASTGNYVLSEKITSSLGGSTSTYFRIAVVPPVAFSYHLTTALNGALGVEATVGITSDWQFTDATVSFGDGTSSPAYNLTGPLYHTYAKPGDYAVTLTVSDAGGDQGSVTDQFATADELTPYGPARLLDTRSGLGGTASQLTGDGSITLKIAGNGSIPTDVKAVALDLTGLDATGTGYIQVDASSTGDSGTSNLNYAAGSIFNNSVVVPVGPDGTVTLRNFAPGGVKLDLVADVSGYYTPAAADEYAPLSEPQRLLDTRHGPGGKDDKLNAGKTDVVDVASATDSMPPTGVTAVSVNLTETGTTQTGYLTAYPDGSGARPTASNLNWQGSMTRAVAAVVPVGADGKIDIFNGSGNGGSADVLVDVTGYFTATQTPGLSMYVPVAPARVLDTRTSGKPVGANSVYTLNMAGLGGTASGRTVTGYVMNTTVTQTESSGWLAVGAVEPSAPQSSTLNWSSANQTVTNLAFTGDQTAEDQSTDTVSFYNGGGTGSVQLIVDVMGYFVSS
jgi:parallel beta-helix repeat protein